MKGEKKRILVVVVKWRHRANGLFLLFYLVNQIILQSTSYFPELTSSLYLTAGTGLLLKNRRNLHKLWWSSWQRTLQITNFNLLFCSVLFVSSVNVLKGYFNVSLNLVAVATVWILKHFLTQLLEKGCKITTYPSDCLRSWELLFFK